MTRHAKRKRASATPRRTPPRLHHPPPKLNKAELRDNYRQDAVAFRVGVTHLRRAMALARHQLDRLEDLACSLDRICRQAEEKTGIRLRKRLAAVQAAQPQFVLTLDDPIDLSPGAAAAAAQSA